MSEDKKKKAEEDKWRQLARHLGIPEFPTTKKKPYPLKTKEYRRGGQDKKTGELSKEDKDAATYMGMTRDAQYDPPGWTKKDSKEGKKLHERDIEDSAFRRDKEGKIDKEKPRKATEADKFMDRTMQRRMNYEAAGFNINTTPNRDVKPLPEASTAFEKEFQGAEGYRSDKGGTFKEMKEGTRQTTTGKKLEPYTNTGAAGETSSYKGKKKERKNRYVNKGSTRRIG